MSKKRLMPTAFQFKQEMQDKLDEIQKLDESVTARLYMLCINNPESPITEYSNTIIKAKSLIEPNENKEYIKLLTFQIKIEYIASIENWLNKQTNQL